ncbi:ribosome small subunit-dependent GTPase A [Thioalkalivibrio paradoxus]|uniref:ribosome small subunit-dependent GTPase A n=1 Tax=Thioalkalivibrio paradoxus TaxID=108010 RepID=UPI00022C211B|nr:ribosome small subunit-dependent GTPase A [Thioalkalivibrio paradoxus]
MSTAQSGNHPQSATAPLRVVARYGSEVDLLDDWQRIHRARLRRRTDDVVCGDLVFLEPTQAAVTRRAKRHNQLSRRDGTHRLRTIAANIDRVWIVIAPQPEVPRFLVDRFLTGIVNLPARPALLVNKWDCIDPQRPSTFDALLENYRCLDLELLHVSAHTGYGLDRLRTAARGSSNILVGQSGVGKSSLIQSLLPREELRIGELGHSGEGRHTTTTARWYESEGGAWIDSPGVRDFTPEIGSATELARGFSDLAAHAGQCRFRDCTHQAEPGCAVRAAVANGELPARRLEAWHELLQEIVAGARVRPGDRGTR